MNNNDHTPTCATCWHAAINPVTLTDVDGRTMVICHRHTLTATELLDSLGY